MIINVQSFVKTSVEIWHRCTADTSLGSLYDTFVLVKIIKKGINGLYRYAELCLQHDYMYIHLPCISLDLTL